MFVAPLVIGARGAPGPIAGVGATLMEQAVDPLRVRWEPSGEDMLARARLREW